MFFIYLCHSQGWAKCRDREHLLLGSDKKNGGNHEIWCKCDLKRKFQLRILLVRKKASCPPLARVMLSFHAGYELCLEVLNISVSLKDISVCHMRGEALL